MRLASLFPEWVQAMDARLPPFVECEAIVR